MNSQNLVVYKSNKVIEAGYKLSLNELRVLLACIGQVQSKEELLKTDKFELSAKDFAKCFDISENRAYSELQEVAKKLFHRYVVIDNPDPEQPKIKQTITHWISSIDYIPDDGKLVLFFAPKILPYLSKLEGTFTKYELKHVGNMNSVYGMRLYELLMQWRTTGKREIEIAWLKKQFELDESYDRMYDLKKRVIEPAVKDINTYSNFTVAWEQRKTGRSVTHLIFTFAEKQPETTQQVNPTAKVKGKLINGVVESELIAKARRGESEGAAIKRIKEEKLATVEKMRDGTPTKPPKHLETWEKAGFKTEKEYANYLFNRQMEEIKAKSNQ